MRATPQSDAEMTGRREERNRRTVKTDSSERAVHVRQRRPDAIHRATGGRGSDLRNGGGSHLARPQRVGVLSADFCHRTPGPSVWHDSFNPPVQGGKAQQNSELP
jgi:hypothetical protein